MKLTGENKRKAVHGPSIDIAFYKEHYGDNWREAIERKGGLTNSPKGTKVLSNDETKELLAQNKIPIYKCNVKK